MLSTRFKYFEISNQNRFIFISKNKILYDIDNNSYIFDAKNLLIEGNEEENRIGVLHEKNIFYYALNLENLTIENKSESFQLIDIRNIPYFDDKKDKILFQAKQLIYWLDQNKFCSRCSGKLTFKENEGAFVRPCNNEFIYPRISPCIITLITKKDKILLARNKLFPEKLYSTLAGFIEVGETAEEALIREVLEEVNIKVKNIKYFGSQSWPFPCQLMLGYHCEYESGDIKVNTDELTDAQWFDIGNLPNIPPKISISGRLIASYLEGHLKP